MPFCTFCGTKNDVGKFCTACGKPLDAAPATTAQKSLVAGTATDEKQSLREKWSDPFYRGSLRAETGELWNYDRGVVTCAEGNAKGSVFKWTGSLFVSDNDKLGSASFDGQKIVWKFPTHENPFYTYSVQEGATAGAPSGSLYTFVNDSGMEIVEPVRYKTFVNWYLDSKKELHVSGKLREGQATKWEILSDVPAPVALIIAMYTVSQQLLEEAVAKANRSFSRCGKYVLTSSAPPILCKPCSESCAGKCFICEKDASAQNYPGKTCKNCSTRKNFCAKCTDPIQGSTTEGVLCAGCGLGSAGNDCCRMIKANPNVRS